MDSVAEFAGKWRENARRERAASHEHFIDLCHLLGVQTPNDADPTGEWYTFEAGVQKLGGGQGRADVWKRDHFGWEYKGKHADLNAAYQQLLGYREDLENPPILVVSDMDRIEVHTNFTNTKPIVHTITLDDLAAGDEDTTRKLDILRWVMTDPDQLRPEQSPDEVTQQAASRFADLARAMQDRGHDAEAVAHFLNRILFCLFAEDVGLLPPRLMTDLIESRANAPSAFATGLSDVFRRMSDRKADRFFGNQKIDWFNGGLFADDSVIAFTRDELRTIAEAAQLDWSQVEPAILGTLFERGLDPQKRGQLGAHYTDTEKILMVVEPVVMTPLRREYAEMRERVEATKNRNRQQAAWREYLQRLRNVRVLDPACGSGNFLYVALRLLKDLEQETLRFGAEHFNLPLEFPQVGPHNVLGIEINPYAKELAGVAIWIGHIQWMREHGYGFPKDPVLQPLDQIELRDAILAYDEDGNPKPAKWPEAEFIVGNPPFLGAKLLRRNLGDDYVESLFSAWRGDVAGMADLCCYWHEQARAQIASGSTMRAGLLATNSVRGGKSRKTLQRIKETGDIFMAWADEPWVVEGANVRVSIIGQDNGCEQSKALDGVQVTSINSGLEPGPDFATSEQLTENAKAAFVATVKGGQFDLAPDIARQWLALPSNVNGRHNSDVIVPWVNGLDVTRRHRDMFIIDFGVDMTEEDAAEFEVPFAHVLKNVRPNREKKKEARTRERWWLHTRPIPGMRVALAHLSQFIVTPEVAKHRVFAWLSHPTLPDHQLIVIAREDDYAFGVLHSRVHELWSLRMGTSLEDRPRYTPTTTFETFPFPWPLNTPDEALTPQQQAHRDAIGAAAAELDAKRRLWLNPPEWVREEPDVAPSLPMRLIPVDDEAAERLKQRTLTNLYNERPTWLANLHDTLDAAVCAAYGWPADIADEDMLERLLALNLERADG